MKLYCSFISLLFTFHPLTPECKVQESRDLICIVGAWNSCQHTVGSQKVMQTNTGLLTRKKRSLILSHLDDHCEHVNILMQAFLYVYTSHTHTLLNICIYIFKRTILYVMCLNCTYLLLYGSPSPSSVRDEQFL